MKIKVSDDVAQYYCIETDNDIAHPDGTFSSSKLENLYPFFSEQEVRENLPYQEWNGQ